MLGVIITAIGLVVLILVASVFLADDEKMVHLRFGFWLLAGFGGIALVAIGLILI